MTFLGVASLLFVAGLAENFINGWHTRSLAHGRGLMAFLAGTIYVLVWYVVLRSLVENLNNIWVALFYAVGSGMGSWISVHLSKDKRKSRHYAKTIKISKGDFSFPRY
jgi:uncharacterized protein YebE (UPF0316 family)